jgi:hypothetical protein
LTPFIESDLPDRLEEAMTSLEAEAGTVLRGWDSRGSEYTRHQFVSTAFDVCAAGRLLSKAQRDAAAVAESWAVQMPNIETTDSWVMPSDGPDNDLLRSLETLRVAWKSWFFFVSAFCDQAYRVVLSRLQQQVATRGGHMSSIEKAANPVGDLLRREAPEVVVWFETFRRRRNEVKEGVMFSFKALDGPGIGITFRQLKIAADGRTSSHGDDPDRELGFQTVLDDVAALRAFVAAGAALSAQTSP